MRWENQRRGNNVEDRRGMSGGGKLAVGGGIGAVILFVLSMVTGVDLSSLSGVMESGSPATNQETTLSKEELAKRTDARSADLVNVVLTSTEEIWSDLFRQSGQVYRAPKLVLFDKQTQSACGTGVAQMGPFYCPADQKAYIDLSFCDELRAKFKAPGDFAVAYVIAHEIGHHIQNLLGRTKWIDSQRGKISEAAYNQLSVKLELQADFYAGIWAHYSQKQLGWLDPSDIQAALTAANAIGDDKLQMEGQGYVVPESFTHGTSEQRMYWFKKGFETGDISQGAYEIIK